MEPRTEKVAHDVAERRIQRGAHAASPYTVFIRDLAVETIIGVYEQERLAPTRLLMDIEFDVRAVAAKSDLIEDTVDYAEVVATIRELLAVNHFRLLETLVEFLTARLAAGFPIHRIRMRVAKTGILRDVGQVGVIAERQFDRPASLPRPSVLATREFW